MVTPIHGASTRVCGECSACCFVSVIPEFNKSSFSRCPNLCSSSFGRCAVYEKRPLRCANFSCVWLDGFGEKSDRPDRVGAMLTITETAPQRFLGFLAELEKDAVLGSAKHLAVEFAEREELPLIVVAYGHDDAGSWVVVKDGIMRDRTSPILGEKLSQLSSSVSLYTRSQPRLMV